MSNDLILKVCKFIYPSYGQRYDTYWNGKLKPFFTGNNINPEFKENDHIFVEIGHIPYFYSDFHNITTPFNVVSRVKYEGLKPPYLKSWNTIECSHKEEFTYITNSCNGVGVYHFLQKEYDTPFISSYFQDDLQYLKFCKNYDYYMSLEPVFGVNKLAFDTVYNCEGLTNKDVLNMFLGDIEITWIHEHKGKEDCLDKYLRRRERSKNKTPMFIWGDSLLLQQHSEEDRQSIISEFKKIPNSLYIHKESREEWSDKTFDDRGDVGAHAKPVRWQFTNIVQEEIVKFLDKNNHLI